MYRFVAFSWLARIKPILTHLHASGDVCLCRHIETLVINVHFFITSKKSLVVCLTITSLVFYTKINVNLIIDNCRGSYVLELFFIEQLSSAVTVCRFPKSATARSPLQRPKIEPVVTWQL